MFRLGKRLPDIGLVSFWALLVGGSLLHSLGLLEEQAREVAFARARMVFTLIETTRLWNAGHGGLYAPVTEANPPNPYLDVPERDVVIDGKPFTMINPAYMTRQISELMGREKGISFHITSLNPIRPDNIADAWEADALARFERGETEVLGSVVMLDKVPTYRYMSRLVVNQYCMACHERQGYQIGDVRGGISVNIPADQVLGEMARHRKQTIQVHLIGFLLLSGASLLFIGRLRQSWQALAAAKAEQERMVAERTRELSTANTELARSNAELENFAYVASHDLQEPLRMMGSYAALIQRRYGDTLDTEGREFLGFMTDGAGRMKAMIDDLLSYSRVGRGQPDCQPVDMNMVIRVALANLSGAVDESEAEIRVERELPTINGEMPLLLRLFQNLIGNAIKYHRPGVAPVVTVSVRREDEYWHFTVTDNGIGIPEQSSERIFQVFQRLHASSQYPGTGIGLAICRKVVERHQGRIWVSPVPTGGSVFHVTLPVA